MTTGTPRPQPLQRSTSAGAATGRGRRIGLAGLAGLVGRAAPVVTTSASALGDRQSAGRLGTQDDGGIARARRRGWLLALLLLALLLVAAAGRLATGDPYAETGALVLAATLALSLAYQFLSVQRLHVTRHLSAFELEYGQRLVQRLRIEPTSWRDRLAATLCAVEVADAYVVPGMVAGGVAGPVGRGGWLEDERDVTCTRWGLHQVGPTTIRLTAPLGLLPRVRAAAPAEEVLVYPPALHLRRCGLRLESYYAGSTRAADAAPRPPAVAALRPYQPGRDALHAVHWPAYALTRELWVRQFERQRTQSAWLILDCYLDALSAVWARDALDVLQVAATSLAAYWLARADVEVGLLLGDAGGAEPARGAWQLQRIKRGIALARPARRERRLFDRLTALAATLRPEQGLIVLTARPPQAWEATLATLRASGKQVVVVYVTSDAAAAREEGPGTSASSVPTVAGGRRAEVWLSSAWAAPPQWPELARALEGLAQAKRLGIPRAAPSPREQER
jgi:uncharacterized protein (DUF58 family)